MSSEFGPDVLACVERWCQWCTEEAYRHAGLTPGRKPTDPVAALAANCRATQLLEGQRWWAVAAARASGASWEEIADVLGMAPERARQRFTDEEHGGCSSTVLAS